MNNALWILASSIQMLRHICSLKHLDMLLIDLEHSSFSYSDMNGFVDIIRSQGSPRALGYLHYHAKMYFMQLN